MCTERLSLISSRMAARLVVLPEPVAPVTKTIPFFSLAIWYMVLGSPRSSMVGILDSSLRQTMEKLPLWEKMFTRKRALPGRV